MSYVNVTELRNHLAPIDKKKDAQKKLHVQLQAQII